MSDRAARAAARNAVREAAEAQAAQATQAADAPMDADAPPTDCMFSLSALHGKSIITVNPCGH
eukprot:scaffold124192_cov17-Prasinocladus_malaysianus.AAC.1